MGNKLLLLFAYPNPSANPPNTKQSVKASFTHDAAMENTVFGVGSRASIALGFASCCICHSTPPLILYFLYITRNGAFTHARTHARTHAHTHTHRVHSLELPVQPYAFKLAKTCIIAN